MRLILVTLLFFSSCTTEKNSVQISEWLRAVVVLKDGHARWSDQVDGCGVFVSSTEILTAGHAIKNGGGLSVELFGGQRLWANVIRSLNGMASANAANNNDNDLALLKISLGKAPQYLPIAKTNPEIGEWITAIGAPGGIRDVLSAGIFSKSVGSELVFSMPLDLGNSGGPLINHRGEIVGIVTRGKQSISLGVSAEQILKLLPELRR